MQTQGKNREGPLSICGVTPTMFKCDSGCGSDQARGSGWRVEGASRVRCLWSPPLWRAVWLPRANTLGALRIWNTQRLALRSAAPPGGRTQTYFCDNMHTEADSSTEVIKSTSLVNTWFLWGQETNTDLSKEALHRGGLPDVSYVHRDLETTAESLGVEQEDNGGLKLPANCRVHFRTHHDHSLQKHKCLLKHLSSQRHAM